MYACSARFQCVVDSSHREWWTKTDDWCHKTCHRVGSDEWPTVAKRTPIPLFAYSGTFETQVCICLLRCDATVQLTFTKSKRYTAIHVQLSSSPLLSTLFHVTMQSPFLSFALKWQEGVWVIHRTTTARRLNTNTKHSVTYTYLGILATYAGTGYQVWALAPLLSPLFALVSFGWCAIAGLQAHNDDFLKRRDFATIEDCREY